jgi:hypothetical protein
VLAEQPPQRGDIAVLGCVGGIRTASLKLRGKDHGACEEQLSFHGQVSL